MVKRKISWLERSLLIIGFVGLMAVIIIVGFSPKISAQNATQVHLQQESMQQFYEDTFREKPSIIVPSGSDAVNVSVDVFENLSLSVVDGNPRHATNWKFGATLHKDWINATELAYTVTADY